MFSVIRGGGISLERDQNESLRALATSRAHANSASAPRVHVVLQSYLTTGGTYRQKTPRLPCVSLCLVLSVSMRLSLCA